MGVEEQPTERDQPLLTPTDCSPETQSSSHQVEATVQFPSQPVSAESDLRLDSMLGPYRLLAKLGEGGMGAVYKAQHTMLDKLVAIKVLSTHFTRQVGSVARFQREMKAVGKLNHPNIVQAFDAGEFSGVHYLAMEFVEGIDLLQLVKNRGPLPVAQACDMIRQTALALSAAHQIGLVHRDIKPGNLLLATSGQIKLLDLGLALLGDEVTGATELTTAGQTFGTPDYMAPEQWEDAHTADSRTDLYALGCTLFYLLIGHAPYGTEKNKTAMSKMKAHAIAPIPDFPASRADVPEGVRSIYHQLLAKSPDERFQSAAELAQALAPFSHSQFGTIADPPGVASYPQLTSQLSTSDLQSGSGVTSGTLPIAKRDPGKTSDQDTYVLAETDSRKAPPHKPRSQLLRLAGGAAFLILCGVIIVTITNNKGEQTVIRVPAGTEIDVKAEPGSKVAISAEKTSDNGASGQKRMESVPMTPVPPVKEQDPDDSPPAVAELPKAGFGKPAPLPAWELPNEAPPPLIAPSLPAETTERQKVWANYLKRPVVETHKTTGMKFALIPPGEFIMSYVSWPQQPEIDLKLRRKVRLTKPFYMGTTEVTRDQYRQFVQATGHRNRDEPPLSADQPSADGQPATNAPRSWRNPGPYKPLPDEPLTFVSLIDAGAYCRWLGKQDGRAYRIPTEAEWEFACQAGSTTLPGGVDNRRDLLNFGWFFEPESSETNPKSAVHPVGQKKPNAFGLFDVVGNVYEWCVDREEVAALPRLAVINPHASASCSLHGSVANHEGNWETGARYTSIDKYNASWNVGFRVVQELSTESEVEPDRPLAQAAPATDREIPELAEWKRPADFPPPALVPFSAIKAREHQRQWAKYVSKDVFETNSLGMTLAMIPPGECLFALTKDGEDRFDSSTPQAKVRITQPFYLATTEVSFADFRKFVEDFGYTTDAERLGNGWNHNNLQDGSSWIESKQFNWKTPGSWQPTDKEPVVLVSHDDAFAFCAWLSKRENVRYRLPYDAEWVFACRAGSTNKSGLDVDEDALSDWVWTGRKTWFRPGESPALPVDSLETNPFGLHHMQGNVHEWSVQSVETVKQPGIVQPGMHGSAWSAAGRMDLAFASLRWRAWTKAAGPIGFRVVRELPDVSGLSPKGSQSPVIVNLGSRPIANRAIVSRPTPIPGLRSWSIEPVGHLGSDGLLAAITADGKHIATVGIYNDSTIRIWNERFELEHVLLGHDWNVQDLKFSPDGRWLASRERAGDVAANPVKVWEVATGRLVWEVIFEGTDIAWSPDSRSVALGQAGFFGWRSLEPGVLDVATGKLKMLPGTAAGSGISRLSWSETGDRLLSAMHRTDYSTTPPTNLHTMRLYDGKTLALLKEHELPPEVGFWRNFVWSPQGNRALLSDGRRLWFWDVELGTAVQGPEIAAHDSLYAAWLPDGERLVISGVKDTDASNDGTIVWNLKQNTRERVISSVVGQLAWIDGGRQLAIFNGSNLWRFDSEKWSELHVGQRDRRGMVDLSPSALTPDGKTLLCSTGGQLSFWDAETGIFQRRILNVPVLNGLTCSPKGDQIASWARYWGEARLMDVATGEKTVSLQGHTAGIAAAAWSPGGAYLATACHDKSSKLWDATTGKCSRTFDHTAPVLGVAWSPSGKLVATVTSTSLYVWNAVSGESVGKLDPLPGIIASDGPLGVSAPNTIAWGSDEETLFLQLDRVHLFQVSWRQGAFKEVAGGMLHAFVLSLSPNAEAAIVGDQFHSYLISMARSHESRQILFTSPGNWHPDSRRFVSGTNEVSHLHGFDAGRFEQLGTLLPRIGNEQFACIGPDGHYRGSRRIDDHLVYVALHDDGSQKTYSPQAFREKFHWQNDPTRVRFLKLLPEHETPAAPPLPPPPVVTGRPLDDKMNLGLLANLPQVDLPATVSMIEPGQPISPRAVVSQPTPIPGLRSWSIETAGHRGDASLVAVHPSGTLVATGGGADATIRLWDQTGKLRRILLGHSADKTVGAINALTWSPGGRWLASTGTDRLLRIWDVQSGRLQQSHLLPLTGEHLAWTPGQTKMLVAGEGWAVVDLATSKIEARPDSGTCVAAWWSPEADVFSVLHNSGIVRRFDLETAAFDHEQRMADMDSPVTAALSCDGRHLAALHQGDNRLGIWEVATGNLIKSSDDNQIGRRLCWSSDDSIAIVGRRISVWDGLTLQKRFNSILPGDTDRNGIAFSRDGQTAIVCQSGRLRFFDRDGGVLVGGSPEAGVIAPNQFGNSLDINGDGSVFWTRGSGPLQQVNSFTGDLQGPAFTCDGHEFRISPDGKKMAIAGSHIYVRDAITGTEQLKLTDGTQSIDVDWSPDSKLIAVVRTSGKVEIRDATTGDLVRELADERGPCHGVKWSPDGRLLVASSVAASTLRVWNVETGDALWSADGIRGRTTPGNSFDWSPDSQELAYWKHDGSIVLAEAHTGESRRPSLPPRNAFIEMRYSPDGRFLAVSESDAICIIELATGTQTRLPSSGPLRWVPNTNRLLAGSWRLSQILIHDAQTGQPGATLFTELPNKQRACIGVMGHYRGSPQVDEHLVYVALLDDGSQQTYTPAEFAKKFGWQNDPDKVEFVGK